MALLQCVVERRLLEVDLARFPKTFLAFLFLAEIHKNAIFAIRTFLFNFVETKFLVWFRVHIYVEIDVEVTLVETL